MPKVLIAPTTLAKVDASFLHTLRDGGFELVYSGKPYQLLEDDLLVVLKGIDASLAGSEPYTARVFAAHPQLRVVARVGVGYDAVEVPAATAHGVAVTIAPNTNQDAVAEHTFSLMLGRGRRTSSRSTSGTVAGKWPRGTNLPLRKRTLGIAGLGRIGKAVALRGEAFGMRLLAYEPYPDNDIRRGAPHRAGALRASAGRVGLSIAALAADRRVETPHQPPDPGADEADGVSRQHGPRRPGV